MHRPPSRHWSPRCHPRCLHDCPRSSSHDTGFRRDRGRIDIRMFDRAAPPAARALCAGPPQCAVVARRANAAGSGHRRDRRDVMRCGRLPRRGRQLRHSGGAVWCHSVHRAGGVCRRYQLDPCPAAAVAPGGGHWRGFIRDAFRPAVHDGMATRTPNGSYFCWLAFGS